MKNIVRSETVHFRSPLELFSYQYGASPVFFVSDRDSVLKWTILPIPNKRQIELRFSRADHPLRPPREGVVRVPAVRGHWRLSAVGPRTTGVEYLLYADPGGWIPAWLANWVATAVPRESLAKLKHEVGKPGFGEDLQVLDLVIEWERFRPR